MLVACMKAVNMRSQLLQFKETMSFFREMSFETVEDLVARASLQNCRREIEVLANLQNMDLPIGEVANRQIISALNRNRGVNSSHGILYKVQQDVANEARNRALLINPNEFERETYSTAVGNTHRMLPSVQGWEMTKGIQSRHIHEAEELLNLRITKHVQNSQVLQNLRMVPRTSPRFPERTLVSHRCTGKQN